MTTAKDEIRLLPDAASFEGIHYRIHVLETIKQGRKAEDGRSLTEDEAARRLSKWIGQTP